ncbi:MAG: hypothetical protein AAGF73_06895 [Actinomycetota bacterium]
MSHATPAPHDHFDLYSEPRWASERRVDPPGSHRQRRVLSAAVGGLVGVAGLGVAAAAVIIGAGPGNSNPTIVPATVEPAPAATGPESAAAIEVVTEVADTPPATTPEVATTPVAPAIVTRAEAPPSSPDRASNETDTAPVEPDITTLPAGWSFSLPVGVAGGIEYAGGGLEQLTDGPGNVAVDDQGGVYVSDPVAGRIVTIRNNTVGYIDVSQFGLTWINDMVAAEDHLIVLGPQTGTPEPRQVARIGFDGALIDTLPLIDEDTSGDFVTGLIDDGDRVIVEHSFGRSGYQEWDAVSGSFVPTDLYVDDMAVSLAGPDVIVGPHNLSWPDFAVRFVSASDNGQWIVSSYGPRCSEDGTDYSASVSWHHDDVSRNGEAFLSLDQVVEDAAQEIASTSDGRVFALDTYDDRVEVREVVPQAMGC